MTRLINMIIDKYYKNKQKPNIKCFKIKFDRVIKNKNIRSMIRDKVKEVNSLQFICYHFIRLFILDKYKNNKQLPHLDNKFIMSVFRVLLIKGRGPSQKKTKQTNDINSFYETKFKTQFNVNKIKVKNISYILQESANEMEICYKNNIVLNFYKYLNQYINEIFKNNYDKCSTKEESKLFKLKLRKLKDSLMYNNINNCPPEYKKWYTKNKNKLLPLLNNNMKNHLYNVKVNPYSYLPHMLYMNKELETKKLKLFQAICLRTDISSKFITINTNGLIDLITNKDKNKYFKDVNKYASSLWDFILTKNKYKFTDYTFNNQITTDGFTICLSFIQNDKIKDKKFKLLQMKMARNGKKLKQKTKSKPATLDHVEFQYIEKMIKEQKFLDGLKELLAKKKIVYGDPGKRDIMKFYDENGTIFSYSSRRRIKETKRKKTIQLIDSKKTQVSVKIKNKTYTIKEVEALLSNYSNRTINYSKFNKYVKLKLLLKNELDKNKMYNDYLLKHKWFSYINKKRHESTIINELKNTYSHDSLFVLGDWNCTNKLQYISTPGISFKRLLASNFKVNIISEFNTSSINCKTFEKNEQFYIKKQINNKLTKIKLHSVLTYKMGNKRLGCINRDINAVKNMQTIVHSLIKTRKRPAIFIRKSNFGNRLDSNPSTLKMPQVHIGSKHSLSTKNLKNNLPKISINKKLKKLKKSTNH